MFIEFAAPVHTIVRIGECLPVKSLGAFCSQRYIFVVYFSFCCGCYWCSKHKHYRNTESECSSDAECPSLLKCCSDGCTTRCVPPHITTQCLNYRTYLLIYLLLRYSCSTSCSGSKRQQSIGFCTRLRPSGRIFEHPDALWTQVVCR